MKNLEKIFDILKGKSSNIGVQNSNYDKCQYISDCFGAMHTDARKFSFTNDATLCLLKKTAIDFAIIAVKYEIIEQLQNNITQENIDQFKKFINKIQSNALEYANDSLDFQNQYTRKIKQKKVNTQYQESEFCALLKKIAIDDKNSTESQRKSLQQLIQEDVKKTITTTLTSFNKQIEQNIESLKSTQNGTKKKFEELNNISKKYDIILAIPSKLGFNNIKLDSPFKDHMKVLLQSIITEIMHECQDDYLRNVWRQTPNTTLQNNFEKKLKKYQSQIKSCGLLKTYNEIYTSLEVFQTNADNQLSPIRNLIVPSNSSTTNFHQAVEDLKNVGNEYIHKTLIIKLLTWAEQQPNSNNTQKIFLQNLLTEKLTDQIKKIKISQHEAQARLDPNDIEALYLHQTTLDTIANTAKEHNITLSSIETQKNTNQDLILTLQYKKTLSELQKLHDLANNGTNSASKIAGSFGIKSKKGEIGTYDNVLAVFNYVSTPRIKNLKEYNEHYLKIKLPSEGLKNFYKKSLETCAENKNMHLRLSRKEYNCLDDNEQKLFLEKNEGSNLFKQINSIKSFFPQGIKECAGKLKKLSKQTKYKELSKAFGFERQQNETFLSKFGSIFTQNKHKFDFTKVPNKYNKFFSIVLGCPEESIALYRQAVPEIQFIIALNKNEETKISKAYQKFLSSFDNGEPDYYDYLYFKKLYAKSSKKEIFKQTAQEIHQQIFLTVCDDIIKRAENNRLRKLQIKTEMNLLFSSFTEMLKKGDKFNQDIKEKLDSLKTKLNTYKKSKRRAFLNKFPRKNNKVKPEESARNNNKPKYITKALDRIELMLQTAGAPDAQATRNETQPNTQVDKKIKYYQNNFKNGWNKFWKGVARVFEVAHNICTCGFTALFPKLNPYRWGGWKNKWGRGAIERIIFENQDKLEAHTTIQNTITSQKNSTTTVEILKKVEPTESENNNQTPGEVKNRVPTIPDPDGNNIIISEDFVKNEVEDAKNLIDQAEKTLQDAHQNPPIKKSIWIT